MPCSNEKRIEWREINKQSFNQDCLKTNWAIVSSRILKYKKVIKYKCRKITDNICPGILKIDISLDGQILSVMEAYEHNDICKNIETVEKFNLKSEVVKLFDNNIKQAWDIKKAIESLKNANGNNIYNNVDIKKIYNIISNINKSTRNLDLPITTDEVESLCNSLRIANNEADPFVVRYSTNPVKILISSSILLKRLEKARNLHIDATYKLNTCKYPVVVVGFTDLDSSFYTSAVCIMQNETAESYRWILSTLVEKCLDLNIELNFKAIIADNSSAISLAANQIFPNIKRINCWAHTWRLMENLISPINMFKAEISDDIHFLQKLFSEDLFKEGLRLFKNKWSQIRSTTNFIENFFNLYVDNNSNWYEGYDCFAPSTNNALEKFNYLIKSRYTKFKQIPLISFINNIAMEIIKDATLNSNFNLAKIKYNEPSLIDSIGFEFVEFIFMKTLHNEFFFYLQKPPFHLN